MSTRHVSNSSPSEFDRLPLPAPSTTNNLLPRFAITALSRRRNNQSFLLGASSRSNNSSSSSRNGNLRSSSRQRGETMQSATPQTRNRGSSSRPPKRRRTRNNNVDHTRAREEWAMPDGDEDEVDQLTSDTDKDSLPPLSQSVGQSSQQTVESQSTSAIGSSTDIGILPQATSRSSVSSPSLAKILHPVNIEETTAPSISVSAPSSSSIEPALTKPSRRFKPNPKSEGLEPPRALPPEREHELLSAYTCPICFFPPTNATITPCGHICCGSCLFTAIKTTMQRGVATSEGRVARCPVCRAEINKWDGKGGGVIGLKARAVFSI